MNASSTRPGRRVLTWLLPLLVLAVGVLAAVLLFESKPTAKRAPTRERQARLVTIAPAEAAPATLTVKANGTVEAADSTALRPQVQGRIKALEDKLAPGTRFEQGDVLARIDPRDYRLALNSAKADLADARAALRVESGQQAVAKRELSLVGSDVSAKERDLALRGPQLEQAKSGVASAKSAVDQAQLDLQRTRVRAPFAGIVTQRNASLGDIVSPSDTLATLAATDVYWVDVSLPVDQLRWLHAAARGQPGSPARIHYAEAWGKNASIPADVLRIQPGLESSGRMARVLLRVPDPLGSAAPAGAPLLIGAYVTTGIQANIPADSVLIDAAFVHDNNRVWVMSDDDTLDIRTVEVAYRDKARAVINDGLAPGDAVITSELTAPIQGMPVRVESSDAGADKNSDSGAAAAASKSQATASADRTIARSLRLRPADLKRADNAGAPRQARAAEGDEPPS